MSLNIIDFLSDHDPGKRTRDKRNALTKMLNNNGILMLIRFNDYLRIREKKLL